MSSEEGWRFKKELSVGEVLTVVSMTASVAIVLSLFMFGVSKRVDENALINRQQKTAIAENRTSIKSLLGAIENQRLESKDDLGRLSLKIEQTNALQNAKLEKIYQFILERSTRKEN